MYAEIGSISHATMLAEDLIPCFVDELRRLGCTAPKLDEIETRMEEEEGYYEGEDASYDLNETLFDLLNEYAPPYCYFGSHPGDGSDYGFWVNDEVYHDTSRFCEDKDILGVSDTSEVPTDYEGDVLYVNDHGNATLYWAESGNLLEIWSIV